MGPPGCFFRVILKVLVSVFEALPKQIREAEFLPERGHRCKTDSNNYPLLSGSIKTFPDETLLLELARRGYDLSSFLEDDMTPAEIVKIV